MRGLLASLRRLPGYRTLATAATDSAAPAATATAAAPTETPSEPTPSSTWTPFTQRTGVIARKRGMTAMWDTTGRRWPVTVLQLDAVEVIKHIPPAENDKKQLHSLQIGASDRPARTTTKQMLGHFNKNKVNPKYKIKEFRVTADAVLPSGTKISAAHFVPGQYVDVTATSIGKGFQGGMKRHGFRGLKASHGVSLTHRSSGSTGQNQDPGRVLPGKKMPGHMGVHTRTQQNLLVHRIDLDLNLVYVRGAVPGVDDAFISVRDSKKKVTWRAQKGFMSGKPAEEWLGEGVTTLPSPAVSVEAAKAAGWPKIVEWPGQGKVVQ